MSVRSWALTEDVPMLAVAVGAALMFGTLVLMMLELRRRERHGAWIVATGVLGVLLLGCTIFRPVRVTARGTLVGPRVVVLVDQSRRLLLPADGQSRNDRALSAARELTQHFRDARLALLGFGDGPPRPLALGENTQKKKLDRDSDLVAAMSEITTTPGERPRAVVVVSDGRLTRPGGDADDAALERAVGMLDVPVHTVSVAGVAPKDASIRAVRAAGAAVAHQPLHLTVEVACTGGLECDSIPVTVRELLRNVEPAVLTSGVAKAEDGLATVELSITLERAGSRVVEIAIDSPKGDTIRQNDVRIMTFTVTRDRIRLLHVAGRPTYDVRALRRWLKSDESVDLVAFFILRSNTDDTKTTRNDELALIPFPVDELFQTHLPSFDAVMLQDIDAKEYNFAQYLPKLEAYVQEGGGVIMVGGPSAFIGGQYGGTKFAEVLPVELPSNVPAFEVADFVPSYTESGRAAPVLRALRQLYRDELPVMPGSNTLGPARSGAIVLWAHPQRRMDEQPMPVLALGEAGDGRSIALAIDGTHLLAVSEMAAEAGGRGFGALWDGLLGWLMRDPRYEAARMELVGECVAGQPATLRLTKIPGAEGAIELAVEPLGVGPRGPIQRKLPSGAEATAEIELGILEPGGYTAVARIGSAPPTRYDFACEPAGAAWADSRPDPDRLARIARVTGGRSVRYDAVDELPMPPSTQVAAERHVSPLLPAWLWALGAAFMLGSHWVLRRRGGLA